MCRSSAPAIATAAVGTWAALLLGFALQLSSAAWAEAVLETTICEIGTEHEGRLVSVFAKAHSSYHGSWLDDESCPRAGGIALNFPPVKDQRGEVKRLWRALRPGFGAFGPEVSVTGRFIGRIVLYPGDPKHPFEDMPETILKLQQVRDLVVKKLDN